MKNYIIIAFILLGAIPAIAQQHDPLQVGMIGDLEKSLIDEGYTYRTPTKTALKKGWNTVLIKLAVKNFNGKNWQNPEKWMFTFTPVD